MSSFEHIYDALQLYKEDPVFLMAVPNAKEMLNVLSKLKTKGNNKKV